MSLQTSPCKQYLFLDLIQYHKLAEFSLTKLAKDVTQTPNAQLLFLGHILPSCPYVITLAIKLVIKRASMLLYSEIFVQNLVKCVFNNKNRLSAASKEDLCLRLKSRHRNCECATSRCLMRAVASYHVCIYKPSGNIPGVAYQGVPALEGSRPLHENCQEHPISGQLRWCVTALPLCPAFATHRLRKWIATLSEGRVIPLCVSCNLDLLSEIS